MDAEELLEKYAAGQRNFQGAVLKEVDLRNTDLIEIDLSNADLTGANFKCADLSKREFDGTKKWQEVVQVNLLGKCQSRVF